MDIRRHWSGRGGRGATQLTGDIARFLAQGYVTSVDINRGKKMLLDFLEL
jgi:hypothetical protein